MAAWMVLACVAGSGARAAEPSAEACPRWHITETASLRVLNYGTQAVSQHTATACETLRQKLAGQWLEPGEVRAWRPKCDIVLHTTDAGYLREVGEGGRNTAASALIERRGGRIVLRRVDVRATQPEWLSTALPHELAHVVVADRFTTEALPRWLDEGMAILADPAEKRHRHARAIRRAIAAGSHFRLAELLSLADYPPSGRWGTFYDQSAALVDYLVALEGHGRFVEFVELALDRGYDHALGEIYGLKLRQLELQWRRAMIQPEAVSSRDRPSDLAARQQGDS